ncbi:hypothetical protein [Streptomyces sp. NPDC088789]
MNIQPLLDALGLHEDAARVRARQGHLGRAVLRDETLASGADEDELLAQ